MLSKIRNAPHLKRAMVIVTAAAMIMTSVLVAMPLLAQPSYTDIGVAAPASWTPGDLLSPAVSVANFNTMMADTNDPSNFRAMRMLPALVRANQNTDTAMRLSLSVNEVHQHAQNATNAFSYAHGGGQPVMTRRTAAGASGNPGYIVIQTASGNSRRPVHTGIDNTVPKILTTLGLNNNDNLRAFGVSTANLPSAGTAAIGSGSGNDMPTVQAAPSLTNTVPIVDSIADNTWFGMVMTSVNNNASTRSAAPAVISFHEGNAGDFSGAWRDRNIFSGVFTNTPAQAANNEVTHWNGRFRTGNPFSNATVRGAQTAAGAASQTWSEHNTMNAFAIDNGAGFVPNAYVHSQGEDVTRTLHAAVMTEFVDLTDLDGVEIALSGHIISTHQWYMSFPYGWNWTDTSVGSGHRGNNRLRGRLMWHVLTAASFVEDEDSVVDTTPVYTALNAFLDDANWGTAGDIRGNTATELAAAFNCQQLRAHLATYNTLHAALTDALDDATSTQVYAVIDRFVDELDLAVSKAALEAAIALNTSAHAGGTTSINVVAPTCTTAGTHDLRCNTCDEIIETGVVTASTGHAFGSWTVVTAADCFTAGSETRSCADCAEVETRAIPMREHD
ncbi:MAG: hypothetical protein FWD06_03500, partial [Oscillospiraceae bacterium]|nr:hypothetical protein [Oscillospiraceae bacterium]